MARKLIVEIIGDDRSLQKALGRANRSAGGFASTMGRVSKAAAFGIGAAGLGGLAVVLKRGADEFAQSQKVAAQTGAVIKSTGGSAKVTAKHVNDLANALSRQSGVDDEVVQSGENMLLTFTNLRNEAGKGNDIFDQSTKVLQDMTVALGSDPQKQAIQLGKALNDPVKGVGALARVGVTFTEGQKKQIATLVKSGKRLEAQKVILKELNKEFGGSAKAAGKTLPAQLNKLKNSFDDVAAKVFAKLVPALTRVLDWVNRHWPEISRVFEAVADAIGVAIKTAIKVIKPIVAYIKQHWPEISTTIRNVATTIKAIWDALWPTFSKVLKVAVDTIIPLIKNVARVIKGVVQVVSGILHGDWAKAWAGVKNIVGGVLGGVTTLLKATAKIWLILATALGRKIKDGIVAGLTGLAHAVETVFATVLNKIIGVINTIISGINRIPFVPNVPKISKIGGGGGGGAGGGARTPTPRPVQKSRSNPFGVPETTSPFAASRTTAGVTHVHVNLDGREIANVLIPQVQRRGRSTVTQRGGARGGTRLAMG